MPHAASTYFVDGTSKEETYAKLLKEAEALFEGQRNWVCNLANTSSLLWYAYQSLPPPSNQVNWAGFYFKSTLFPPGPQQRDTHLILGPFAGRVACQIIALDRGVCGIAATRKRIIRVDDVDDFEGHIACDTDTRSEIVVPILVNEEVLAIIDVDCKTLAGFDVVDEKGLESLASLLAKYCDWK